jgi:hypothetical protein
MSLVSRFCVGINIQQPLPAAFVDFAGGFELPQIKKVMVKSKK